MAGHAVRSSPRSQILRAAVNYYQEQHGLSVVPKFTMPAEEPASRHLPDPFGSRCPAVGGARLEAHRPGKWVRDHVQDYRGLYFDVIAGTTLLLRMAGRAEIARRARQPRIHGCLQPGACPPDAPKRLPVTNGENAAT